MSIPIYAADAYYQDTLEFYIGGQDYAKEAALWDRYIESRKFTSAPPATDDVKADFRSFISFYTSLKLSPLDSTQTVLQPDDDFYNMYLNGFYGNLSDNVRKDIWNSFLKAHNYTENLQNSLQTVNPPDSTQVRTLFASYIKSLQQQATQLTTYSHPMSPQQELQRTAVYDTLGALRKYLDATQNLMANQAAVLLLYANWQQEYTKMMQKIPILEGGLPGQLDIGNLSSADKYTFGYGNISLQDVVNWGYKSACENPNTTITFGDKSKKMGAYSFKLTTDSSGNKTLRINFDNGLLSGNSDVQIKNTSTSLDLDFSSATQAIGEAFIHLFKSIPNFSSTMASGSVTEIRSWLLTQLLNHPCTLPEYSSMYSVPLYKGIAFTWNNDAATSDSNKKLSITVRTEANAYAIWDDGAYLYRNYSCVVETKIGTGATVTKKFTTTLKYIRNYVEGRPVFGTLVSGDINNAITTETMENPDPGFSTATASDWIDYILATSNCPLGNPLAIPGYLLGTISDPASSEYTTTVPWLSSEIPLTVTPTSNLQQREIQARGEAQAALTNYSQTIKGIRDMLGSLATRQQSTLGQAKESLQQQSDIFTAILESIDSVMKAITQK